MDARFVEVALPVPLASLFTYRLPVGREAPAGTRVRVQFGARKLVGVVFGPADAAQAARHKTREVEQILDLEPLLGEPELALARWLADYWFAPPGEAIALLLPPRMAEGADSPPPRQTLNVSLPAQLDSELSSSEPDTTLPKAVKGAKQIAVMTWLTQHRAASADTVRQATGASLATLRRLADRGLLVISEERRFRDPLGGAELAALRTPGATVHPLTIAQTAAVAAVSASLGRYQGFLLHGVTGSGKTEVYLALIETALARGEGAIVLVPEIALTPQLVARFRARLGDKVAVQHSGLDPFARHEQWLRIRSGELPVVVGARSALFSPMPSLGLVVVDEEHEPSFKQETSPRYHARDLALVRGHLAGVPVVLGSATPSLESWTNVQRNKLVRLSLPERAHTPGADGAARPLPEVELIDMREAPTVDRQRLFSRRLLECVEHTLSQGEQVILFLNRRGYASSIQCRTCGEPVACTSCSVAYTWHRQRARLVCHYCDETRAYPEACPKCHARDLAEVGAGTEHIEEALAALLPAARIGRMDKDTTRGKALIKLLGQFRKRELDLLIGTQMVAKGHDFPGVTLVGVLNAEQGLAFPDFRAAERTFQLLTQIAGRAGRADRPGKVLMQTHLPEHYAITHAARHDVVAFLDAEAGLRRARAFPPASHLALFRLGGPSLATVEAEAGKLEAALLAAVASDVSLSEISVLPAQPAPIERIKDRWRYQVLIKSASRKHLRTLLEATRIKWETRLPAGLQIALDVDPIQFL